MADTKITALTELTTKAQADALAIVDDTTGTPITKKITVENLLTPEYFFAEKTSQQVLTTSLATVTSWVAAEQDDAAFSFNNTTGILTINTTGIYMIGFGVLFNLETGTRVHCYAELQLDPLGAGSYAKLGGMGVSGYGRIVDQGSTGSAQRIISATATDLIRIQAKEYAAGGEINSTSDSGTFFWAYLMA